MALVLIQLDAFLLSFFTVSYDVWAINPGDSQFGVDLQGVLALNIVFGIFYLFLCAAQAYSVWQLRQMQLLSVYE